MTQTKCGISGCKQPHFNEGVCFWHYPLWEYWSYEEEGYRIYLHKGQRAGRRAFHKWLKALMQQKIVDILSWRWVAYWLKKMEARG